MNNREILFRGREYYTDEWVYGYLIEDDEGLCIAKYEKERDIERRHAIDPNTVGQFTGLLDKEGNKIFEGDILRTMSGIAVVVWLDAAFALKSPGSEAVDWEHSSVFEQSEILGNIHQTPELIQ